MNAQTWMSHLEKLYSNERNAAVDFLLALAAGAGHANLFAFLHVDLGMSKSLAYYRQTGARLVREFPATVEPLRDGRLCVSSLVELSKVITDGNWAEVLPRFFGCSKREAQKVAVAIAPAEVPAIRDVIVAMKPLAPVSTPSPSEAELVFHPGGRPDSCEAPREEASLMPVALVHRIHFTASQAFVEKLEKVKDVLARRFPEGNLEALFEAGLDALLKEDAKKKGDVVKPRTTPETCQTDTESVPAAVRRAVWKRDNHECQWPLASGGLCGAKRFLDIDHIHPEALGGPSTLENLRLLCRFHNQEAAQEIFGVEWMDRYKRKNESSPSSSAPSWGP